MNQVATSNYYDGEAMRTAKLPEKERVLRFMRSFDLAAVVCGRFSDVVTGETVKEDWRTYEVGAWTWDDQDIYHVEKYDLELDPAFVAFAMAA